MSVAPVSCFHYTQDITLSKGNDEPRSADNETKLPICRYEYTSTRGISREKDDGASVNARGCESGTDKYSVLPEHCDSASVFTDVGKLYMNSISTF